MSNFEKLRLESDLKRFTSIHFERPAACRNSEQIRYYVAELCTKIEEYKRRFNYVPNSAYALLAQYNARQNSLIHLEFKRSFC